MRDDLSGFKLDRPWKYLLIPGVVVLWLRYMFPQGGWVGVARTGRQARSPIMVYLASAGFYFFTLPWLTWYISASLFGHS